MRTSASQTMLAWSTGGIAIKKIIIVDLLRPNINIRATHAIYRTPVAMATVVTERMHAGHAPGGRPLRIRYIAIDRHPDHGHGPIDIGQGRGRDGAWYMVLTFRDRLAITMITAFCFRTFVCLGLLLFAEEKGLAAKLTEPID